ncbi:collagen-like protein [Lactiplantibacillus paraplantarum]|uniref:collagen-like protein n=1 Tax=Lactiplantibacillus paraplantarum TaxID=60520 RepID=UPI0021D2D44A|nr:collagen-like protein [Lactiplantibacillus paraplantarum]MCU4683168.1 collagen-like protein [Lactiplantibacillus paraplantarum]MCU4683378.1 collagen-like protein [Lactiplantibacillus paraplantarum]
MAKTLSFTDMSPRTVKIGDTTTSFTLICGNDNVATDLTKVTSITVKLGNTSGYLKSATVDPASLTDPTTGQVTVNFTADLMTSLPAGSYSIEVWVVDSTGTSIYPSDGSTGFTITNNIQSANGSTITTITFDDFVAAMNKAASTIAKGDKGDTGTVDNAGLISAPAFQSLQAQVNNSAVGTNLLTGTGYHTITGSSANGYLSNETTNDLLTLFKGLEGQTVTVSVDYKYSGFIAGRLGWEIHIFADSSPYIATWYNPNNDSGSGRVSSTFVVPKNITSIGEGFGYIVFSGSGTATLSHLKMEKGSVATDWCPNPSEILTQSDYAKIKAAIVALGGALS